MSKTVVVTGANRGIGLALAQQFAARGDHVIGVCRKSSAALEATGARVEAGVDVTDEAAVQALAKRLGDVRVDILGPSEAFRKAMDYFSHSKNAGELLEKLARHDPTTLACMHGSAWRGDGASLLRALAGELVR